MTILVREEGKVGDIVYEPFQPQNPGIIRKVIVKDRNRVEYVPRVGPKTVEVVKVTTYEVEWFKPKKGEVTTEMAALNFLDPLIESHQRKADKFSTMADDLSVRERGETK